MKRFSFIRASSTLLNKDIGLRMEGNKNCNLLVNSLLLFGVSKHLAVPPGIRKHTDESIATIFIRLLSIAYATVFVKVTISFEVQEMREGKSTLWGLGSGWISAKSLSHF